MSMSLRNEAPPSKPLIRVVLVNDHTSVRELLAIRLAAEPDIGVVGEAGTLAEARQMIRGIEVDVAIVDLHLPDGYGTTLIRDLRATNPSASALVLTASGDRRRHAEAVAAGAAAVLHKAVRATEIIDATRRLHAGQAFLSREELGELLLLAGEWQGRDEAERTALGRLTAREREVLQLLATGMENREIADRLHVGIETVRSHVASLLGKLRVESRMQAVLLALRHGLIHLD